MNDNNTRKIKIDSIFQRKKERISKELTTSMWLVLIAALPNILVGGYIFGIDVYRTIILSVIFCAIMEWAFNGLTHTKADRKDISYVVTGVLFAFLLPSNIPVYALFVGCFFATIIVKKIFGGQGYTVVNPAVAAAIFMWSIFPVEMANLPYPDVSSKIGEGAASTPWQNVVGGYTELIPGNMEMLLGFVPGGLGSVSIVAILVGGILLMITRAITPTVPFIYLATIGVLAYLFSESPEFQMLNGSFYLAAFFLLGDPHTIPKSEGRKAIFAIFCGILSFAATLPAIGTDGTLIAILIMNIIAYRANKDSDSLKVRRNVDVKVIEKETEAY